MVMKNESWESKKRAKKGGATEAAAETRLLPAPVGPCQHLPAPFASDHSAGQTVKRKEPTQPCAGLPRCTTVLQPLVRAKKPFAARAVLWLPWACRRNQRPRQHQKLFQGFLLLPRHTLLVRRHRPCRNWSLLWGAQAAARISSSLRAAIRAPRARRSRSVLRT